MCQSSPSPPAVPDYQGAAIAQGAANLETARASARLSNPNVYGPLGSQTVTYGQGDQQDIPTVTQTLTPDAQAALAAQQRVQRGLAGLGEQGIETVRRTVDRPFDANVPDIQTSVGAIPASNTGAPMGMYGVASGQGDMSNVAAMPVNAGMTGQEAIMARLEPMLAREGNAARQRLANQGLVAGGEAYTNEIGDMDRQQNDLRSQAALQGINLDMAANNQGYSQAMQNAAFGNQAMTQNYGQAAQSAGVQNAAQAQDMNQRMQAAQFGNTAQQQALAQQLALRNQPLNEISALMSGSQIQTPQFGAYQGQNIAPAPIMAGAQAQNQAAMQQYGIQQAGVNANNAGLYGLGGAALRAGASLYP